MDFITDKYKDGSPKFIDWLIKQLDRDDLIGDVALDIKRVIKQDLISKTSNYENIWEYISDNFEKHNFFIQHSDADPDKKRHEVEKQIGHKLHDSYVNTVSPLLCLQLAWDEYESFIKRKKFALKTKSNAKRSGYVYFIGLKDHDGNVKIGFSSDTNFLRRQKNIETASPHDTFLIGYIQSDNYVSLENELHKKYNDTRKKREWFTIPYADVRKIIAEHNGTLNNASH
jgi:hypothetical protein